MTNVMPKVAYKNTKIQLLKSMYRIKTLSQSNIKSLPGKNPFLKAPLKRIKVRARPASLGRAFQSWGVITGKDLCLVPTYWASTTVATQRRHSPSDLKGLTSLCMEKYPDLKTV